MEFLADERFGLTLVRRHEEGLGCGAEPQWLTVRVQHGLDAAAIQVSDRVPVEVVLDAARQRAGEDHGLSAAREIVQLLAQDFELVRLDVGAPLVDLGIRARGRVDDGSRGARLVADADEVVEDRLGGQLLHDPRPGAAAGEPGGDDGDLETLERPRDVDPLPAGEGQAVARAVAMPRPEVRNSQRPVDRRVQGDGDDHLR